MTFMNVNMVVTETLGEFFLFDIKRFCIFEVWKWNKIVSKIDIERLA